MSALPTRSATDEFALRGFPVFDLELVSLHDLKGDKVSFGALQETGKQDEQKSLGRRLWRKVTEKVEGHRVGPVPLEARTKAHFLQNFVLWLTMNATIGCFATGTLGPLLYNLSFRDSMLVITLFNVFACAVPSYLAIFGPRLGLRTMTVARYSFGFHGAILPALINLLSFAGFLAVHAIIGGQVLSAIDPAHISLTIGIILIPIISEIIGFCGYKVLHVMEKWAWIPVLAAFVLLAAFGGRHLDAAMTYEPKVATAWNVLSFAAIVVGASISWSGCSADYSVYQHSSVSSFELFSCTFTGLYLPSILIQLIGASFSAAALSGKDIAWQEAFANGNVGALASVALAPLGVIGKIVLAIFALGMITNNAPTTYAFSLSISIVFPALASVPRFAFALVSICIYLPIAIVGATHFDAALSDFLGLLGYWYGIFTAIVLVEHFVYRSGDFTLYEVSAWDQPRRLPLGLAAVFSSICGIGMVVLSMDQVWWRGPISKAVTGSSVDYGGDLGFELSMAVSGVLYFFSRYWERRVSRYWERRVMGT